MVQVAGVWKETRCNRGGTQREGDVATNQVTDGWNQEEGCGNSGTGCSIRSGVTGVDGNTEMWSGCQESQGRNHTWGLAAGQVIQVVEPLEGGVVEGHISQRGNPKGRVV